MQKRADRAAVKLETLLLGEDVERLLVRTTRPVGTHRRNRVKGVRRGDDPSSERDLFAAQPVRIPLPVQALVMMQDDRGQLFVTKAGHHLGAVHWVTFDEIELPVGEPVRLIENLRWNAELADIVDQRGGANRLNLSAGETHLAGDASGVASHAIGMTPGVSILGFQRRRQSPEKFLLAVNRPSCRTLTVTLH
ncbi:MAG: hypothetical protein M3Z27_10510 [Actinomycetota bacterium]|nr:hypothetical protein [Actinomycetota bacterium]